MFRPSFMKCSFQGKGRGFRPRRPTRYPPVAAVRRAAYATRPRAPAIPIAPRSCASATAGLGCAPSAATTNTATRWRAPRRWPPSSKPSARPTAAATPSARPSASPSGSFAGSLQPLAGAVIDDLRDHARRGEAQQHPHRLRDVLGPDHVVGGDLLLDEVDRKSVV